MPAPEFNTIEPDFSELAELHRSTIEGILNVVRDVAGEENKEAASVVISEMENDMNDFIERLGVHDKGGSSQ